MLAMPPVTPVATVTAVTAPRPKEVPLSEVWPETGPVMLLRLGTTLVALLRSGIAPETELRPEAALDALGVEAEVTWVWLEVLLPADVPHGAPRIPAAAETPRLPVGRLGSAQRSVAAPVPPSSCVTPLTDDVGEPARDTVCASAGAARPTVRMLADATPPSRIR